MKQKISTYLALFAALGNIAAAAFLLYALDNRHVYDTDSSVAAAQTLGSWLFAASVVLWLGFVAAKLRVKRK